MAKINGGRILVEALAAQGADKVYCVPGESYLTIIDALYDYPDIALVSARHEGAAANMAEADGKLTGRPGICMVTRGPGATHASIGVHTAFQASTPMILFIGQVAIEARDREGFQEVDYRAMFGPLAKWVAEIDDPSRIPEYIARAFQVAMNGRPGPVVLSVPEDMLSAEIEAPPIAPQVTLARAGPLAEDLAALIARIEVSHRPLLVVGGTGWDKASSKAIADFARRAGVPLVASFRRQDVVDNRSDIYCGHLGLAVDPKLSQRLEDADLVISVGSRLGENTTGGYILMTPPVPRQDLIHIHPDPGELGRVYQPSLAIACAPAAFALALEGHKVRGGGQRAEWLAAARADYVAFSTPPPEKPSEFVDLAQVVGWLSENLPEDALIANGAGNHTVWIHRFYRYKTNRTELAPVSGAMGYGVPAAIAGSLRHPDRKVVAITGDGCFLMYPQEIGTAAQYGAKPIFVVVNNSTYGTIRMHQERRFPKRVIATDIVNPDFVAMARSFGLHAERVTQTADFAAAFERASAAGGPALIEVMVDPAQLTPGMRIPD